MQTSEEAKLEASYVVDTDEALVYQADISQTPPQNENECYDNRERYLPY